MLGKHIRYMQLGSHRRLDLSSCVMCTTRDRLAVTYPTIIGLGLILGTLLSYIEEPSAQTGCSPTTLQHQSLRPISIPECSSLKCAFRILIIRQRHLHSDFSPSASHSRRLPFSSMLLLITSANTVVPLTARLTHQCSEVLQRERTLRHLTLGWPSMLTTRAVDWNARVVHVCIHNVHPPTGAVVQRSFRL